MNRPPWVSAFEVSNVIDGLYNSVNVWDSKEDVPNSLTYRQRTGLASFRFYTSSTTLYIEYYSNAQYQAQESIEVFSNGSYVTTVLVTTGSVKYATVTLPAGSNKLIEVYEGSQNVPDGTVYGSWIRRLVVPSGQSLSVILPSLPEKRIVVYGDSKSAGFSVDPMQQGWTGLVRLDPYPGRLTCSARGNRSLNGDYTQNSNSIIPLADLLALACDGTVENIVWIDIGFNDYYGAAGGGIASWTAAVQFKAQLQNLVTRLLTYSKITAIYLIGTILWSNESTENSNGETLNDFRIATEEVASELGGIVTYVDATDTGWPTTNDLSDGIHPNVTGHSKYHTKFKAVLGY